MGVADFVGSLKKQFGGDLVSEDSLVLAAYAGDRSAPVGKPPALAVFPESTDQVRGIVTSAFKARAPLVPVSSLPPRSRTDTVRSGETAIVDFSRMRKILKIDPVKRFVRIEPGVTYGDLLPELRKQGLRINAPLAPRPGKSVLTSRLERVPMLIPKYQYDYVDPLLTLEIVYGTGDVFRTGSASGPGTPETLNADMVAPWGPGVVDFFRLVTGAQGSMGFVTWATLKAEVLPRAQKLFYIPIEDETSLSGPMNALLFKRVPDECLALSDTAFASLLAAHRLGEANELRTRLPKWTVIAVVAGYERYPEERVAIQERYLREICREQGVEPIEALPGLDLDARQVLAILSGTCPREDGWSGGAHSRNIFFLSPMSKIGDFVGRMTELAARAEFPAERLGGYVQPMVQGRGCHIEFSLSFDPDNREEAGRADALFREASEDLLRLGAFFSRPYGVWADLVYRQDPGEVVALRKLKEIFDPANILNPGTLCFEHGVSAARVG